MRRQLIGPLAMIMLLVFPAVAHAQAATVVRGWPVNLDSDPHIEHVRLMLAYKPNPFGGTVPIKQHWLQVVDRVGGRIVKVRISPIVEHVLPRFVKIGDLNGGGERPRSSTGVTTATRALSRFTQDYAAGTARLSIASGLTRRCTQS